jgi:hypothetical protein
MPDVLILVGFVSIFGGIALISVPASIIVGGVVLLLAGLYLDDGK